MMQATRPQGRRYRRYAPPLALAAAAALAAGGMTPASAAPSTGPQISPADGTTVTGSRAIVATPAGDDPVTSLDAGGAVVAVPTLGAGTAELVFDGQGIEASYSNYLLVNGEPVQLDTNHKGEFEEQRVAIDQQLLVEGSNTIRFATGTRVTGCGVNHDDLELRILSVRLDSGAEYQLSDEEIIRLGDGSCGSNPTKPHFIDLPFDVDVAADGPTGMLAVLDPDTVADGPLTVRAESASGAVTETELFVDTTGPELVSSSPSSGATLTGTITVGSEVDDPSGVAEPVEYRLDGSWIDAGATIDADELDQGEHTLEITARDLVGNVAAHEVVFQSERSTSNPQEPHLSVTDGDVLSGEQHVLAKPGTPEDPVSTLLMGGDPLESLPTLGEGTSTLTIEGSGMETQYANYLLVNGERVALDVQTVADPEFEFFDVAIPNSALATGPNELRVQAGTVEASCGTNYDDFQIRNVSLELFDGSVLELAGPESIKIGDGTCGSNTSKPQHVDFSFAVDAQADAAAGLLASVDTRSYADGPVQVAAESEAGVTASASVTIDNTAPELLASTPAEGELIASDVELDLRLRDLTALDGEPIVTLDGDQITVGDTIAGGELAAGDHLLEVAVADVAGNEATFEIPFSSTQAQAPTSPTELSPANGATGQPTEVELSAVVDDPDGGSLTATFYEGQRTGPVAAYVGTAGALPRDELDVPGQHAVDPDELDESGLETGSSSEIPYQRFDLPVADLGADRHEIAWSGSVDPARAVVLSAWDVTVQEWIELTSSRGVQDEPVHLAATVGDRFVDDGVIHARVEGQDPFADDIGEEPDEAFRDPSAYDFAIAHITDTQYLSQGAMTAESPEERAMFADAYLDLNQWIVANADDRKIEYVAHSGDLVESHLWIGSPERQERARAEYEFTSQAQSLLEEAGIPNGVLAGNHDNANGNDPDALLYNEFFGPERYEEASASATQDYYGEPWRAGDNQNHYDLFSAGGLDFVVVYLAYGITEAEAQWADGVLEEFSDRNAIVVSHAYLKPSQAPDGRGGPLSEPDGSVMRDLVNANPSVVLTLAGHETGVNIQVRSNVGEGDHDVIELLADYQGYTVDGYRLGASFLRMLQFDVDRGELTVDTYSPYLDEHGAREYDMVEGRYDGTEDEFTVPLALTSRQTSFTTTGIELLTRSAESIGEVSVEAGEAAQTVWTGLAPDSNYGWYVEVENAEGLTTRSDVTVFSTADAAVAAALALRTSFDGYVASGDIAGPFTHRLTNALDLVQRHVEAHRTRPAIAALERFIRHLDSPAPPDTISPEARDDLRGQALALIDLIG